MSPVERRVDACRRFLIRRGGWAAGLVVGLGVLLSVLTAWLFVGSGTEPQWGYGSAAPLVALGLGLVVALLGVGFVLRQLRVWGRERTLVREMEGAAGLPSGRILAQLELSRAGAGGGLTQAGETQLLPLLSHPESSLVGEGGRALERIRRRVGMGLGMALTLTLVLGFASPERTRVAFAGLIDPVGVLRPPPLAPFQVKPGNARVLRGATVLLEIEAPGRAHVTLHLRAPGSIPETRIASPEADGRVTFLTPAIDAVTTYWVEDAWGTRSADFTLEPEDPLLFEGVEVSFFYPPHTGLEALRIPYLPPSISIPSGTRVEIAAKVDDDAEALLLVHEETGRPVSRFPIREGRIGPVGLPNAGGGGWTPDRSMRVLWVREGGANDARPLPGAIDVEVIQDEVPRVSLRVVETDADGRGATLKVEATDDWGLDWVELEWRVRSGAEERPLRAERIPLQNARAVTLDPRVILAGTGLPPGGEIRLQARAADRGVGPGIGVSSVVTFQVPDAAALRAQSRTDVAEAAARIEALSEEAAEQEALLRDLARALEAREDAARNDAEMGRADPEARAADAALAQSALEAAEAARAELAAEIEAVRAALAQAAETAGPGAEAEALRARIAELDRLLDDILAELGAAPSDPDQPPSETLAEAAETQERVRDRLEAATERFQRAVLENALERASEDARDLAARLDSIAQNTPPSTEAERAERAQALDGARADAERLEAEARALESQLLQSGDSAAAARAAEAAERAGDAEAALERGEPRDLVEASQSASEAGEALDEARETLQARAEAIAREGIRAAALSAIQLARLQGALALALATVEQGETADGRRALVDRQGAVVDGFRNLGFGLRIALLAMGGVPQRLGEAMVEVTLALDRAVVLLRQAEAQGALPALDRFEGLTLRIATALHEVALRAFETADAEDDIPFGDSGEATAGAGGGGEEGAAAAEAVEAVAGEQETLNRQAEAAAGRGAGEGASEEIEALARAQEAVGSALESLANRAGEEASRGTLEALAREAEALAEALRAGAEVGRLEGSILSRQEAFLERLLDAGRTLERDAPTEERQGTPAGMPVRIPVPALPGGLLRGDPAVRPSPEALSRLTPAERQLVLDYFDRIQRGGTTSGGGRP